MKEKLIWGLVIIVSMTLGSAAAVVVDSLRKDDPTTSVVSQDQPPTGADSSATDAERDTPTEDGSEINGDDEDTADVPSLRDLSSVDGVITLSGFNQHFSVRPEEGQVFECEPDTVLDGNGVEDHAFYGYANNVTIRGCIIQNYITSEQQGVIYGEGGSGWIIENNEIRENAAVGVYAGGDGWIIRNNNIHHNHQLGIRIVDGKSVLVENNEIAFNNYEFEYSGYWESGGAKFSYTEDLVVRGNNVHDNIGPGLWTDIDNVNTLYENNTVEGNDGIGIEHEISYSAIIKNNVVRNNGGDTHDWLWGAQIMVYASSDVEVHDNTVVSRALGGQGIAVTQDDREEYQSRNVYVHHNDITGPGINGADENPSDPEMYDSVSFNFNNYHGSDTWFWDGEVSFQEFQEAGQELNGTSD